MTTKMTLALAGIGATTLLSVGCGNNNSGGGCSSNAQCGNQICNNGVCVQCTQDSHCNGNDKTLECQNYACAKVAGACGTDAECPGGRCWNVAGKAYGKCGPARR